MWNNSKWPNICLTVDFEKRGEIGTEKMFTYEDIMIEKFSLLMEGINLQCQEAQQVPNIINIKKPISCYTIVN